MLDCCRPPALSDRDLPATSLRSCRRSPPTLGFHQLVHRHCSFPDTVKRDGAAVLSLPAAFSGFPNRFKEITIDPQRDVWCLLIRVFLFLCFLPSLPTAARLVCPLLTHGAAVCCTPLVLHRVLAPHSSQDGLVQVLCMALELFRLFGNQTQRVFQSWKAKASEWR